MKKWFFWILAIGLLFAVNAGWQHLAVADCTDTYENFGKAFMEQYCTRCHASTKTGFARFGAPAGYDFDKPEGIAKEKKEILEWTVEKKKMPPVGKKPTDAELSKLTSWLNCEYP